MLPQLAGGMATGHLLASDHAGINFIILRDLIISRGLVGLGGRRYLGTVRSPLGIARYIQLTVPCTGLKVFKPSLAHAESGNSITTGIQFKSIDILFGGQIFL